MLRLFIIVILLTLNACTFNKSSEYNATAIGATLRDAESMNKDYRLYVTYFSPLNIFPDDKYNEKMDVLHNVFLDFSEGIGKKVLAIWAGNSFKKFDSKISKDICDKYELPYAKGPYILVTKNDPISKGKQDSFIVINFSDINPDRIRFIISDIEKQIRLDKYKNGIDNIDDFEYTKQMVFSFYDNNEQTIKDIVSTLIQTKLDKIQ